MQTQFLNEPSDVQWLLDTHLKGVCLSSEWKNFQSFVIEGNEDSPEALNLYKGNDPLYREDYLRVVFSPGTMVYATYALYDGNTNKPKGGLSPLD